MTTTTGRRGTRGDAYPGGGNADGMRELMANEERMRELEARFDARFQAVSARFVRVDNRFAGLDERHEQADRHHRILDELVTSRLEVLDAQLKAADARIEELRERIGGISHGYELRREQGDRLGHRILVAVLVSTGVTVALWASTMAILRVAGPIVGSRRRGRADRERVDHLATT